jgi:prophage regulatory protein
LRWPEDAGFLSKKFVKNKCDEGDFMEISQHKRLLRRPDVEAITGLKRSSIYAKMEAGVFPKPIKLSERSVAWLEHEVQGWLESRISASRPGGALC